MEIPQHKASPQNVLQNPPQHEKLWVNANGVFSKDDGDDDDEEAAKDMVFFTKVGSRDLNHGKGENGLNNYINL